KICDALEADPGFQQGAVLRLGPLVKPELGRKYADRVVLDEVVARLGEGLQNERAEQVGKQRSLEGEQEPIARSIAEWQRLGDLRARTAQAAERSERLNEEVESKRRHLQGLRERLSGKRQDLDR